MFTAENQTKENCQRKLGWEAHNRRHQKSAPFPVPSWDSLPPPSLIEPANWCSYAYRDLCDYNRMVKVIGKRIFDQMWSKP